MSRQKTIDKLVKAEGELYLINKRIKELVEQREQLIKDVAECKKELNINPQSELIL